MREYPATLPQKGDTLMYKLKASDNPVNPDMLHSGVVIAIFTRVDDRSQRRYYLVQSCMYPDCEEFIHPEQVDGFYAHA